MAVITQLFHCNPNGSVDLMGIEIVDNRLISAEILYVKLLF